MLKLFKLKSLKNTNFLTSNRNERTQEKNKKQRGRSMVEMLGVLAIIGVLSIGGIQGYTMAMRKYRANEILNVIQKYAMIQYTSCQQAMEQNPDKYGVMGDDTYYISGGEGNSDTVSLADWVKDIWYCPIIAFTDAGLGPLPSGVLSVGQENHAYSDFRTITIKSLSSGDAVSIYFELETKELCEAIMSITGKPQGGEEKVDSCVKLYNPERYVFVITTMMN